MKRAFRIVVVEDSETQAFKLRLLLEEQGWQVSVAGAAEAALAALGDPLPDLILVDYNLPGMRGDEFCRRIRMNLNTRGIPHSDDDRFGPGDSRDTKPGKRRGRLRFQVRELLKSCCCASARCCAKRRRNRHSESPGFRLPQRPHIDHRRQSYLPRLPQRRTAESRL